MAAAVSNLPSHSVHKNVVDKEDGSECSRYSQVALLARQNNNHFHEHLRKNDGLYYVAFKEYTSPTIYL